MVWQMVFKILGIDQTLADFFQAEDKTIGSEIHKVIHANWNRE
jgi:hypothetical protein